MKTKQARSAVDLYFANLAEPQKEVMLLLRNLIISSIPDLGEGLKWGLPWYWKNENICYLASYKNHVDIGFAKGIFLDDPDNLLVGKGKEMRHVKINTAADVSKQKIIRLLKAAARIDSQVN